MMNTFGFAFTVLETCAVQKNEIQNSISHVIHYHRALACSCTTCITIFAGEIGYEQVRLA